MSDKDKAQETLTEQQRAEGKVTLDERKQLGKEKKLWRIEVMCRVGTEIKRHTLDNNTDRELFQFRQYIFTAGLMLPIDPGQWVIVPPGDLTQILVFRQTKFFEP